jgi:hypothetical protein
MTKCAKLTETVEWFAVEMEEKLHSKASEGWSGWDVDEFVDNGGCAVKLQTAVKRLLGHIGPGGKVHDPDPTQAVDVANFAMMIAARERRRTCSADG